MSARLREPATGLGMSSQPSLHFLSSHIQTSHTLFLSTCTYTMAAVNFYAGCHFFDISVKYGWIVDVNGLFWRSDYPPKSAFNTYLSVMRPLVRGALQSEVPWTQKSAKSKEPETGNLNFSKTIKASWKSFEDITDIRHETNISFIHLSLKWCIWSWWPCKRWLHGARFHRKPSVSGNSNIGSVIDKIQKCAKMFCSISRPILDGFQLSIHDLKAHD